jgi:4-hydroxy-3-methylbut-2-enyl diphosphate reductase
MTEKIGKTDTVKIITAENCGFCFGVKKAVDILQNEIELSGKTNARIYLLGKIIHNNSFIGDLTKKNVVIIDGDDDFIEAIKGFEENSTVVIRAHGIPKIDFEYLCGIQKQKNLKIADATCECVKRMHRIAEENTGGDTYDIILRDPTHP